MQEPLPLPIDPIIPEAVASLARGTRLILRAPPGAGKTTRVPAALLDAGLAGNKEIVVLEPRRIAARAAAEFVASERGDTLGGGVGYRVRFEHRGSVETRLWFVTEGTFSRRLVSNPLLEGVGIVVLDEFHERHLQSDLALAIVRELQDSVRPDLRLVVMSATLDTESLAASLGDSAILTSEGRAHPVSIDYSDGADREAPLARRVASALGRVLRSSEAADDHGDVLVFLPGAAEIRRSALAIESLGREHDLDIVTLHGSQPLDAQQQALRPGSRRRVVLSTNVAETALTVAGVTTVIDSGLARVARLDARHGMNTLRVTTISRASADQRAGRAGRTAPGRCLRLWTRGEHAGLRAQETPEVLRLDLSRTVLELRGWGLGEARRLRWLDVPPEASLAGAERLLARLGALDGDARGNLTETGRRMLDLPVPPRVARLLVEAEHRGCAEKGALLAALATERDIFLDERPLDGNGRIPWPTGPSDLLLRLDLFEDAARRGFDGSRLRVVGLDPGAVRAVKRARGQLAGMLARAGASSTNTAGACGTAGPARGPEACSGGEEALLRCILAGFPDRVAKRRGPGSPRAVMVGGRGVILSERSVVREEDLFVATDVEGTGKRSLPEARVRLASAVRREWLRETSPGAVRESTEIVFDQQRARVVARTRELFHDLILSERVGLDVDPVGAAEVLATAVRSDPVGALDLDDQERGLLARIAFLHRAMPELGLPADADSFLAQGVPALCANRTSLAEIRAAGVLPVLRRMLTPMQRDTLERHAPTHLRLPSGRRAAITYHREKPPAVAARIQELFGLARTPRLARGRVPLVIEILAPNQRPVQVTDDLGSFWSKTYAEVRRQLRGRYPKHHWPEDPLTATPSSRPGRQRR